jgi:hypothetical protein
LKFFHPIHYGCLLIGVILLSGCVLPGGDRPVGAIQIDGKVLHSADAEIVNGHVDIVRKYGSSKQQFDALFNVGDPACNPARRYSSSILPDGSFSLNLPSFLSGDPIWIIPPLFTLISFGERADKQGLVFLMKITKPSDQIYEVDVRDSKPKVRIYISDTKQFRALTDSENKMVRVEASNITTNLSGNFSMHVRRVYIQISQKELR